MVGGPESMPMKVREVIKLLEKHGWAADAVTR